MKVKYPNQVAFCKVVEADSAEGSLVSTDLSAFFPSLEAGDAILIKRVTFNLTADSEDLFIPSEP